MNRLIRFATKVYPRAWRERYGDEFEALLDDAGADGRIAFNVLRGAVLMRIQHWMRFGSVAVLTGAAVMLVSWWVARKPYITPGTHQVFHSDSILGDLIGCLVFLAVILFGMAALFAINDRKFPGGARAGLICAGILLSYMTVQGVVSLLTPRTIVSIGDSYCWDSWCMGVERVDATTRGADTLYTATVSIFSDTAKARRVPVETAKSFFDVHDGQGQHYPLLADASFRDADVMVNRSQSVRSSIAVVVPTSTREIYLMGHDGGPTWVHLALGGDLAPLHRTTLLRLF